MEHTSLTAISPIDGRYAAQTQPLATYFSEFALIRNRVLVEVKYFIALCDLPLPQLKTVDKKLYPQLHDIYLNFTLADAQQIKDTERITNHDVKAVEYFLKKKFEVLGLGAYGEFIHFGLTSQDVNNTATPLCLKGAMHEVMLPQLEEIQAKLGDLSETWRDVPMLAHTHGQPASPTRLGKELRVFAERLQAQLNQLQFVPYSAKFGGATGNFNAHKAAYPNVDWVLFANNFVHDTLNLHRSQTTTQVEHYDNLAALFDAIKRLNTILIDLCRDLWAYISMGYFKQKIKEGEVGSSAMPHKVNPIDFENAEGNLGLANALLEHLSAKLPISRLQRDLTDSTVLRNIGVPLGHTLIAYTSLMKGLNKLLINEISINSDLEASWAVVAEGIQTILRREGYPKPYETLKTLTRTNEKITQSNLVQFIDSLNVMESVKVELKELTPWSYTGY
jgi:adenylosuccinate lyase